MDAQQPSPGGAETPPAPNPQSEIRNPQLLALLIALPLLLLGGSLCGRLAILPAPQVEIAGFSTSLEGRTRGQRHNARLSVRALDGRIIRPGAVFSFNRAVNTWSLDQGYVKAPVSYDGELIRAFGGGVCQTSTTLYNAALLAGLPILERHRHVFRPQYIAPGRDAAVAYPGIDLRFRNPYPWPLRLHATVSGGRLEIHILGAAHPAATVRIATQILSETTPTRLLRAPVLSPDAPAARHVFLRSPGTTGYRVMTYRIFSRAGHELRRERLGDDSYPAMNHIVALPESDL